VSSGKDLPWAPSPQIQPAPFFPLTRPPPSRSYGGALAYTRSMSSSSVSIEPVRGMPPLRLLVTNTRVPKETSRLVAGVRVLHDALPAVVKPILLAVNGISAEVIAAIAEEQNTSAAAAAAADASSTPGLVPEISPALHSRLSSLLRVNHALLNALGVGHAALDEVVAASAKAGCVAKLTGAGGGGCALTLLPPRMLGAGGGGGAGAGAAASAADEEEPAAARVRALVAELEGKGWDTFQTQLGGDGVVMEG
jgi:mevalonate kinase